MTVPLTIGLVVAALGGMLGLGYRIIGVRERGDVPATPRTIRRAQKRQRADLRAALRRTR